MSVQLYMYSTDYSMSFSVMQCILYTYRQATEPNHVYPKARPRAEELLELMRLTADLQQKVTKLNEDVRTGKEANGIHTKKILTGLRKATEGVHIAFELDEVS